MIFRLKIVIFHGKLLINQMVNSTYIIYLPYLHISTIYLLGFINLTRPPCPRSTASVSPILAGIGGVECITLPQHPMGKAMLPLESLRIRIENMGLLGKIGT